MTITQEVPVSRAFGAYASKPPQAHEIILSRLFLMMKTTARIITGRSRPWRLYIAAGAYLLLYNEIEQFTIS